MIRALVFDFDGLILDTETTIYQAWTEEFGRHGVVLDPLRWLDCVGATQDSADRWFDPPAELEMLAGHALDRAALTARADARNLELLAAAVVRPGVTDWIACARARGLALAIASSSDLAWLYHHLDRIGLRGAFDCICGLDHVGVAKPSPDVYLATLDCLGVDASEAIAIEDSPNGIRAAKAAGLRCIAVPTELTGPGDFSAADRVVASLAAAPLEEVLTSL